MTSSFANTEPAGHSQSAGGVSGRCLKALLCAIAPAKFKQLYLTDCLSQLVKLLEFGPGHVSGVDPASIAAGQEPGVACIPRLGAFSGVALVGVVGT